MKNRQENLATLTISSHNVTTSTREPTTRAWISADIWRQDGAICSKNRKIVPNHGSARIPGLTVSIPDYGSWSKMLYLTNRFHVAVRLFSNRSQMTSKCGKNKNVAHEAQPSVSRLMFLTWNLFVLFYMEKPKTKKRHLMWSIIYTKWNNFIGYCA